MENGIEPIADIVINHRDGLHKWADFKNPDWGTWAITKSDEAFCDLRSEVVATPLDQRGAVEEKPLEYTNHGGTTYPYNAFRDIDHTNTQIRRDILKYLLQLKSMGYRGWRYDMVHGYHAKWIALTKSLATEWAKYHIWVNSISPGYMEGPLAAPLLEDPNYGSVGMDSIPMHRPSKPEELCSVAVLLASEASSYMTGANVVIDGGYTAW